MSENNKRKFMDEELENVAGGGRLGHSNLTAREMKRQEQVEQLAKEAVGRMDPNDPSSWFKTVTDVFDEKFEKK